MIVSLKWLVLICPLLEEAYASVGDSSPFYNRCVNDCKAELCQKGTDSAFSYNLFGFVITIWTCQENCEYMCQWKTVAAFQKKHWKIPQFKGKWPFIRLFGLQEPASVIFSLFNFFVILKMFMLFKKKVPKTSPYYYVWHLYTGVCLNCWIWSSVYHTRDNEFSERMDYMSAFLMVVASFYTMGLRLLSNTFNIKTFLWTTFCAGLAFNHLAYLCLYSIDYEYNMKLNCTVGALTVLGWLIWTFIYFPTQPYLWKASAYAALAAISTVLEVFDFPPLFWVVDAHALWHLSTVFINVMFYRFLIDDCIYLNDMKYEKLDSKSKLK